MPMQEQVFSTVNAGSSIDEHKGSEMSSMLSFAKHVNVTPELVINSQDYWGIIYDNWTGNGLLGNIAADKADIGFGALYTWEADYHFLDLSHPLIRSGITCLTPTPKLAAGWFTPLYSFSKTMWCLVAAAFVSSAFIHFVIFYSYYQLKGKNSSQDKSFTSLYEHSMFIIFKLFIVQLTTAREIPPGLKGTLFMGMLFLFSLFLSSSYSSGLSTVMTIPSYEEAIDTVEELAISELYWVGTHTGWTDSISQADYPIYRQLLKKFKAIPEETLREYSKTSKYAFALERLPHENYAIGPYIQADVIENYILMSEDIYWEEAVVMTRKNSILLPQLNSFISKIFEAGLINYWQKEATLLHMDSKIQKAVHVFSVHNRNYMVKLKWVHLAGAFTILCVGCLISTFIFVVEIFRFHLYN